MTTIPVVHEQGFTLDRQKAFGGLFVALGLVDVFVFGFLANPGDAVRVEFEEKDKEALRTIPTVEARIAYLTARGYSDGVAQLIAEWAGGSIGRGRLDTAPIEPERMSERHPASLAIDQIRSCISRPFSVRRSVGARNRGRPVDGHAGR